MEDFVPVKPSPAGVPRMPDARYHVEAAWSEADAAVWRAPAGGLRVRDLFDDGESCRVALIRVDPGAGIPLHLHPADGHVFVLAGKILDGAAPEGAGAYGAGTYLVNPSGSRHRLWSPGGGLAIVHWHGAASGALRTPIPMDVPGDGHPDWKPLRRGLRMRLLYDGADGYRVALLHYRPGAGAPRHLHVGDEHVFILKGSQQDEHGVYGPGSYVFNPAGSVHEVDSPEGCLVLIHWQAPVEMQVYGEKEGA